MSPDEREQPFEVKDRCPNCERLTSENSILRRDFSERGTIIRKLQSRVEALEGALNEIKTLSVTVNGFKEDPSAWMREVAAKALAATEREDSDG